MSVPLLLQCGQVHSSTPSSRRPSSRSLATNRFGQGLFKPPRCYRGSTAPPSRSSRAASQPRRPPVRRRPPVAEFSPSSSPPPRISDRSRSRAFYDWCADLNTWRKIVAGVRARFPGHLTLSPTALDYATIRFWNALDSLGVSAYFPLAPHRALRDPRALALGWRLHRVHLEALARLWRKPLTFVEVGYPSTEVAAVRPWDYRFAERALDLELQDRCWQAFKEVWAGASSLRSFRIWGLSTKYGPNDKTHSPLGKPAEATVASIFAERG